MTEPPQQLDLQAVLNALRDRWKLIALVAVVAAGLALGASLLMPDRYDAEADLLFRQPDPAPNIDPSEPQPDRAEAPERIAATSLGLASLDKVSARVETKLDTDMSVEELRDSIKLEPQGQADIVTITASAETAEEAALIANTFAAEVVALRREDARAKIQRVIDAIDAKLAGLPPEEALAGELRRRTQQLSVEKGLETGEAEVAEKALPPLDKSAPKPLRNTLVALLLGLIVGIILAIVLKRLDRRVESEDEVSDMVGAPVIARIPVERSSGWERELFIESFQFLRANLQLRDPGARRRSIAITSALPGNGKSTVAARLSEAIALSGSEVIVVDCDLRRPSLHEYFGVDPREGVTTALIGRRDPVELLQPTRTPGVRVLPAGPVLALPASVLAGSTGMAEILEQLSGEADYVIVDTSPVTIGADTSAIASVVDATVMVVDLNSASRDVLAAAIEQLRGARADIVGVVINRAEILLKDTAYQGYFGVSGRSAFSGEPAGAAPALPLPPPAPAAPRVGGNGSRSAGTDLSESGRPAPKR